MEHPNNFAPGMAQPQIDNKDLYLTPAGSHQSLVIRKSYSNTPLNPDFLSSSMQYSDKIAEIQDLTRLDKNARTVLHRAALDQNFDLVVQLCERAKAVDLANYVDTVDKFGNTPLLLTCVMNNTQTKDNKLSCIEALINYGAKPNERNNTTLWTPLTWCAFYGDVRAVEKLLEHKAFPYHCDKDGCFPLDHCGLQDKHGRRRGVARVLIENLIQLIQKFDAEPDNLLIEGYEDYKRTLASPILRTSILYWTIYFKLSVDDYVRKLLDMEGVYPDFPIATIYDRNCYHACAYEGEKEVLLLLLEKERHVNFYKKYLEKKRAIGFGNNKATIEKEETEKMFVFTGTELKNKMFSKAFIQYTKDSVKWVIKFEHAVAKLAIEEIDLPKYFEAQDSFGNAPLHIASFLGRAEIVEILLKEDASMLIENKDGWRCQDLQQYPKVEQLYKEHSKKLHEEEIGAAIGEHIGLQLQIFPKALAASSPKKRKLFKGGKVSAIDTKKETSRMQQKLQEKFAIYNQERFIPDVVLVFQTKPQEDRLSQAEMDRINFNISLIKTSFDCYLSSNVANTRYYLMIKMSEQELETECTSNGIKMKLMNSYGYQVYDTTRKVEFEPFRSRQRQEITLTSLNKLIDIQQLKDIGILKDIYTMHTVSGINRIKEVWFRKKWYWPEPFASVTDYIKEGKHLNFTAITTLRTYFGEKVAFYFAWASFYTCFLLILAIPGLLISAALWAYPESEAFLLPIWAVYNSLCSTLVVERWKRKSSEIATRWGTIDKNAQKKRILRTEFVGDETVHETTGAITKTNANNQTLFFFLVSVPILLVLLGCVVGSFLYTQYLQKNVELNWILRMLLSATNGVIISVLNYLYMNIARYFVDKENHKYADTYENSLIFKVFVFLFMNSYLGLFYVIFIDGETLDNIHFILISLLISKQASSFTTACVIPWLRYKYRKSSYFKELKSKAKKDAKEREGDKEDEDGEQKKSDGKIIKRAVLNCREGTPETDKWDLMRVELASLRTRNDEFVDEFGQMFIQCGYITMFAPGFPAGPLISVIANIIDIRSRLFALLHIHHRPPSEKAGDIGIWQNIWEIMSIVGIFVNAVILFFSSNTTIGFLEKALMDEVGNTTSQHDIRRLWVFLIIVNVILVLKLLVSALIKDKPDWVVKEEKRQNNEEKHALQTQKTMASFPAIFDHEEHHHNLHKETESSDPRSTQKKKTTLRLDTQPDQSAQTSRSPKTKADMKNAPNKENNLKYAPYKDNTATKKKPAKEVQIETSAALFKKVQVKEVHSEEPKAVLPLSSAALDLNHGIKSLLFNAFSYMEKELMMKRLGHLGKLMQEVVIKCDVCKKNKALLECQTCAERYCDKCMEDVHKKTVRTAHKIIQLSKIADATQAIKGVALDVVPQLHSYPTREEDVQQWQKVESFSFPVLKVGDPYNNLEKAYKLLYRVYIEENGISGENTITNVELALKMKLKKKTEVPALSKKTDNPEQPNQLGDASTVELKPKKDALAVKQHDLGEVDYEWLDEVKRFFDLVKFNLEEKLWMNRIAFMVFKKRGAKTTYNDFYRQLKILEEAPLEAKVILLFELVDEDSDGTISVNDLLKLLNVSFLQNTTSRNNQDDIIKTGLKGVKALNKKSFVDEVLKNDEVKQVLMAYMQAKVEKA